MKRIVLVIAAAAAVLSYGTLPSAAGYSGEAPWCAVMNIGAGTVTWDCQYATVEACTPNYPRWQPRLLCVEPVFFTCTVVWCSAHQARAPSAANVLARELLGRTGPFTEARHHLPS